MREIIALLILEFAMIAAVFCGIWLAALVAIRKGEHEEPDDWD